MGVFPVEFLKVFNMIMGLYKLPQERLKYRTLPKFTSPYTPLNLEHPMGLGQGKMKHLFGMHMILRADLTFKNFGIHMSLFATACLLTQNKLLWIIDWLPWVISYVNISLIVV